MVEFFFALNRLKFMKSKIIVFIYLCLCISAVNSFAQKKEKPNAEIAQITKEISAKNIETTIRKLASFGTRNTLSEQDNPARGIGAARDYLYGEFQKISQACGNCLTVEKQTFTQEATANKRVLKPTVLTNVYAVLKGTTNPDRVYVVSGHYDSMCNLDATDATCDAPGANDDASGTAASLEMARVMSKYKFDATIVFMTVPGEEQGLLGATYFAEQAKKTGMDIEAMFTNDIIGGVTSYKNAPDRQSVRVFAEGVPSDETEAQANSRRSVGGENDSASRQLGRFIKDVAEVYSPKFRVQLMYRRDRYLRGGDHIPFLERGFSAVRFTEPHEDYTHQHQSVKIVDGKQYGDLPEFVDFGYVANVTRINAASLAALALAPARPKNAAIVTTRLTNDTDLKWDANKDADLAGYEVVWRDTTSAFWTNSKFIGNVTSYTAKEMSKDNYFFGVRAIDKAGNKSPVSFPKPAR
jgi:Zn-dependent M28 family amino/carboxypeptidase